MKFLIFVGLIVSAVAQNVKCPVGCTREYKPVCASSDQIPKMSFSNKCMMETYACNKNQSKKIYESVKNNYTINFYL